MSLRPQLVDVEAGGVDDDLRLGPQVAQRLALGLDAVEQPAVALERVRAADALEPAHERLVGGVEEDEVRVPAGVAQRGETRLQLGVERPGPHVDDRGDLEVGDAGVAHLARELGHRREQLGRQVVDDVVAAVLDDVGGRRATGTAHPRDDDEVGRAGHRAAGRPRPCCVSPAWAPSTRSAPSSSTTSPVARLTAGVVSAAEPNSAATTAASAGPMPGNGRELLDRGLPGSA